MKRWEWVLLALILAIVATVGYSFYRLYAHLPNGGRLPSQEELATELDPWEGEEELDVNEKPPFPEESGAMDPVEIPPARENPRPNAPPLPETDGLELEEAPAVEDRGFTIVIDPGHQRRPISAQETMAPSSSQTKPGVSGGATGTSTGIPEYEFNLAVSQKLKEALEERGYRVILTRDSADVSLTNQQRAQVANDADADIFLRIHANSSTDPSVSGLEAYYVSSNNPDVGSTSLDAGELAEGMMTALTLATGAKNRGVHTRDDLTGNNFALMPTVLLELGYMSNPQEDQKLNDPQYQDKLVEGMVLGVESYFP
ncbi:MAG: N-acetylmuramoyl-L-alanine amidase [Tissierellia bacterium]|nr:N-acetylmuramoyl-L-alanine amidase [Tissierellia bacterium]